MYSFRWRLAHSYGGPGAVPPEDMRLALLSSTNPESINFDAVLRVRDEDSSSPLVNEAGTLLSDRSTPRLRSIARKNSCRRVDVGRNARSLTHANFTSVSKSDDCPKRSAIF